MVQSIFIDKQAEPDLPALKKALGKAYKHWQSLEEYATEQAANATGVWNFAGAKYGWSFRVKDKKRVILYLLPCNNYFIASLVFGGKATDDIMGSDIADSIKTELKNAKVYAEGRGIRIEVKDGSSVGDIKKLIAIKTRN